VFSRIHKCKNCHQSASIFRGNGMCRLCFGSGKNVRIDSIPVACENCNGLGLCPTCNGDGIVTTPTVSEWLRNLGRNPS
jgi:DnaJ-class molecular chaperone